jgi:peptide/nickel transport system permease protein
MASDLTIGAARPARKRSMGLGAGMLVQAWRTAEFKVGLVVFIGLMLISLFGPDLLGPPRSSSF